MADLSNPLTQITTGQSQKEVTVNNLIDALSPAAVFGQNDLTTSGLNWGYYGGRYRGIAIAHGTIALPASEAAVYIVANKSTGVVSQSTSITNWNDTATYERLYLAVTGSSTITDWDDYREIISSASAGAVVFDTEAVQDVVGALVQAGSGISVSYDDASSPATLTISNTAPTAFTSEQIEDIVGALVVAGSNVTVVYDDAASPPTITIASTGGGGSSLTQEQIEDIVGSLIVAGSNVTVNYDDASSPATLSIASTASGGTSPTVLYEEPLIMRVQVVPAGTSYQTWGTNFSSTGSGSAAAGVFNAATPLQMQVRAVFSSSNTSERLGIRDSGFSHRYNSTANVSNWTSKFWFGTDAAIDTRSGVWVGYSDLNVMNATPSTSLTNMIGMGADGGASGDTNWQVIRRTAGAAVKVDTGIARAANQFFKVTIQCVSGTGFTVTVEQMSNFTTGWAVVFGPATYTTDIPASSTNRNLGANCERCTHSTTGADSICFMYYVSTHQYPA